LEEAVLLHVKHHVQVARRTAVDAALALSAEAHACPVFHSRRDLDLDPPLANHTPFAVALGAGIGDHAARARARRARPRNGEEPLLISHLPPPAASAARGRLFTLGRAGASASLTALVAANVHLGLHPERRFLEFEAQVFAQVGATLSAIPPAAAARAEQVAETEQVAEDVAEVLEDGGIEPDTARAAHARVSEAIVLRALVAVGEHRVRLAALLEAFFGIAVAGIPVGMVLHGQLAVGALDFLLAGAARHPQHLVVVAFCVGCQNSVLGFQFSVLGSPGNITSRLSFARLASEQRGPGRTPVGAPRSN